MNSSSLLQTVGNISVGIAALIYALPLQYLLLELSRKQDDGGGVLAGIILLLPMWLLLLTALLCVTAGGGFDGLRLSRTVLNTLVVLAVLSMTALSFMCFEFPRHSSLTTRLLGRLPVYIFPVATMLLVILSLNPRLAPGFPLPPVKLTWLVCAGLSLLLCGGFFGYRFGVMGTGRVLSLASRIGQRGPADLEIIAQVTTLDPQRDFTELLRRVSQNESRTVRDAATARLRTNPGFVESLSGALTARDPSAALEFLSSTSFSTAEQAQLALPARTAIERFISDIPAPNYMSSERRNQLLRWGRKTFPAIAEKFSATDVDFKPTLASFEHALRPDDTRRR